MSTNAMQTETSIVNPLHNPALQVKENANKALWEKGDFTLIANTMRKSGEELVDRIGVKRGEKVLEIGCGDGTTALPAARLGAEVLGVDIADNLVAAANYRAQQEGLTNCRVQQGDACELVGIEDQSFDKVISIFGAMFAPKPYDVAEEMVRVTRKGGSITMGNWIPNDPTLIGQILAICSAYNPTPPAGFVSPVTWGVESIVTERFVAAGIPKNQINFVRESFVFDFKGTPTEFLNVFRDYYGPTMNAFASAKANGKAEELQNQLEELFNRENTTDEENRTIIPATFLRATINL